MARHRDLDRRLELLDAVVHHLGQRGVAGVSVRGIARDLGMNPSAAALALAGLDQVKHPNFGGFSKPIAMTDLGS